MTYQGFFVRDNKAQQPNQRGSSWSTSPDIIILTDPPKTTAAYFGATGYGVDYGNNVNMLEPNYIYLRALNTNSAASGGAPINGRGWFYFVESDLVLWPQNWRGDCMTVAGQKINYQPIVATGVAPAVDPGVDGDPICLTDLPFIWTPPPFQNPGNHYCLVSWIENTPVEPPQDPVDSFGAMGSWDDLVNFVLDNPNMGWRNTNDMTGQGLTWSRTTNITGPTVAGIFNVGIQCHNMPTDGEIGFSMPPPGPVGSGTTLPMQTIPVPNWGTSVAIGDWPGGAASSIVVNYKQGATTPPHGSNIVVTLTALMSTLHHHTMARIYRTAPHMVLHHQIHANDVFGRPNVQVEIGPTPVVMIGAQTYAF